MRHLASRVKYSNGFPSQFQFALHCEACVFFVRVKFLISRSALVAIKNREKNKNEKAKKKQVSSAPNVTPRVHW